MRPILIFVFVIGSLQFAFAQDQPSEFEGTKAGDRKELAPEIFFRWCPRGKFKMGENDSVVDVELTTGFWFGETEVTQDQWRQLMRTTPWNGKKYVRQGDGFAASYISYDDASLFIEKLTTRERNSGRLPAGWKYSLPTQAQWEYACRADSQTTYSFGDNETDLSDYGWWGGGFDFGNVKMEQYAHRVGLKKPNAWGLKDMHGNVWEWCSDWYEEKLLGGRDPISAASGSMRVYRGRSWDTVADFCTSAFRSTGSSGFHNSLLGFRIAAIHSSD